MCCSRWNKKEKKTTKGRERKRMGSLVSRKGPKLANVGHSCTLGQRSGNETARKLLAGFALRL